MGDDNIIDLEDLFAMKQIENSERRRLADPDHVDCESTAHMMFRAFLEDHVKRIDKMILGDSDEA